MPRRKSKNPDQLSLAISLPSARATRAELVDEAKKRTRRRFRHFSTWPRTGVKLLVLWHDGWREGTVILQHWYPGKGQSVTVRLQDGAEIEVDELRALGPLEE